MELLPLEDDRAVDDLLAIVDGLYAPHAGALGARERRRRAAANRQALRQQVEQLQRTLDAVRQVSGAQGSSVDMAKLWARIAMHQREQRKAVTQRNEQLKQVVRRERALARHVTSVVQELQSLLRQAMPRIDAVIRPGPSNVIPALLARRIDAVCDQVPCRAIELATNYTREHEIEWNDARTVLRFRFRIRTQYPFKLSVIADEFWRLVHEQAPSQSLSQDEVYYADTMVQSSKPFGWVEVRGPTAMRRVYTPDGGVLLVNESILAGTKSRGSANIMAGLEMHETRWVRLVRTDASNPKSPVFIESVTESHVFEAPGKDIKGYIDDGDHSSPTRLERFRDYLETYVAEEREDGRQQLENRLLDASLADKRASPLV